MSSVAKLLARRTTIRSLRQGQGFAGQDLAHAGLDQRLLQQIALLPPILQSLGRSASKTEAASA